MKYILLFLMVFSLLSCGSSSNKYSQLVSSKGLIINFAHNEASLDVIDSSSGLSLKKEGELLTSDPAFFTLENAKTKVKHKLQGKFYRVNEHEALQEIELLNEKVKVVINYKVNDSTWFIRATIESLSEKNKGWRFRLHLPLIDHQWVWGTGPNTSVVLNDVDSNRVPVSASWYPLTNISSEIKGDITLSVPISNPVIVNFSANNNEIISEFSLGTSELTKEKNKVTIAMDVWVANTKKKGGGFRESLQNYYDIHHTYFDRQVEKSGLWTAGTPERLKITIPFYFHEHGNIFFSNDDSSAREVGEQIAIDSEYGLLTLPYLHIGQMSRIKLSKLPDDNTNLNNFLRNQEFAVSPQQFTKYRTLYPDKARYNWKEALAISSTLDSDLLPNVKIRETSTKALDGNNTVLRSWNTIGKQVSFVINPDPDIAKNGISGHGKNALRWLNDMLESYPRISGIYIDSLAGWSKYRNYNSNHFRYSDYPLACDENGNVYLPNAWGHIKFLKRARKILHKKNKLLMGNSYRGGIDNFFVSSIVDVLGNEDHNDVNQTSFFGRATSGIRPLLRISSQISKFDDLKLKKYINSSLALGILPSSWGSYFSKNEWLNFDESFSTGNGGLPKYLLHKEHWQRVSKLLENYQYMEWTPVTEIYTNKDVSIERFMNKKNNGMIITLYRGKSSTENKKISLTFNKLLAEKINKEISAVSILGGDKFNFDVSGGVLSLDVDLDTMASSLSVIFISMQD